MSGNPLASAIIPAKNEEEFLPRLLKTLKEQSYDNLEIVVVDDGSTDNTARLVKYAARDSRFPLSLITHKKSQGLTKSRNDGIKKSKGEMIVMFDADNEVNSDYIKSGVEAFDSNTLGVTPTYEFSKDTIVERSLVSILPDEALIGKGMPMFWDRKKLEEIGLWDESLGFGGDKEIYRRVLEYQKRTNEEVKQVENAVMTVHLPHTIGEVFWQQHYYGRGASKFLKGNLSIGNLIPYGKLLYPLIIIGPVAIALKLKYGALLFIISIPYMMIEISRTIRGLKRHEISALLTPVLDGVKSFGLFMGILDYIVTGEKVRK